MNTAYYKPSGKVAPAFYPLYLVAMAVGIPILSVLYIYLVHYVPFIYLSLVFAIGCGLGLGFLVNRAAKLGKARNPVIVIIFTIIALLLMKYVQWTVFIPLVFSKVYELAPMTFVERFTGTYELYGTLEYLTKPSLVYEAAVVINEYGSWAFGDSAETAVAGAFLLIIWLGELFIMGASAVLVSAIQPKQPFSEATDSWYTKVKDAIFADVPTDFDSIKRGMESGNYADLTKWVGAGKTNQASFMTLTFYRPPEASLQEPFYMSISHSEVAKNGKAKMTKLIDFIAVPAESFHEMTALSQSAYGEQNPPPYGTQPPSGTHG